MEESALLAFWEKINFTISFECQQLTQEGFLLDPSLLKRIDDARNQNDVSNICVQWVWVVGQIVELCKPLQVVVYVGCCGGVRCV